jgi:hypothetical protein
VASKPEVAHHQTKPASLPVNNLSIIDNTLGQVSQFLHRTFSIKTTISRTMETLFQRIAYWRKKVGVFPLEAVISSQFSAFSHLYGDLDDLD